MACELKRAIEIVRSHAGTVKLLENTIKSIASSTTASDSPNSTDKPQYLTDFQSARWDKHYKELEEAKKNLIRLKKDTFNQAVDGREAIAKEEKKINDREESLEKLRVRSAKKKIAMDKKANKKSKKLNSRAREVQAASVANNKGSETTSGDNKFKPDTSIDERYKNTSKDDIDSLDIDYEINEAATKLDELTNDGYAFDAIKDIIDPEERLAKLNELIKSNTVVTPQIEYKRPNNIWEMDVTKLSDEQLQGYILRKPYASKEERKNSKIVTAYAELSKKLDDEYNKRRELEEAKADKVTKRLNSKLAKLEMRKSQLTEQLDNIGVTAAEVYTKLQPLQEIYNELTRINELGEVKKAKKLKREYDLANIEYEAAKKAADEAYRDVQDKTIEYNNRIDAKPGITPKARLKKGEGQEVFGKMHKALKDDIKKLENNEVAAEAATVKLKKMFLKLLSVIVDLKRKYNASLKNVKSAKKKLDSIDAKLQDSLKDANNVVDGFAGELRDLNKEKQEYLDDPEIQAYQAIRAKLKPINNEMKQVNKTIKAVKDTPLKNAYAHTILDDAPNVNKNTEWAKTDAGLAGNKEAKPEIATPLNLNNALEVKAPTSTLGSKKITGPEFREVIGKNNEQVSAFIDNFALNADIGATTLATNPYMMLLLSVDGSLNKNVYTAIRVAADESINDNFNTLVQLTPKNLASMYNVKEENVSSLTMDKINGGIPAPQLTSNIGSSIMNKLGLKAKVERDTSGKIIKDYTELYEKIEAALGQIALMDAVDRGVLQETSYVVDIKGIEEGTKGFTFKIAKEYLDDKSKLEELRSAIKNKVGVYNSMFLITPDKATAVHTEGRSRNVSSVSKRNENLTKVVEPTAEAIIKSEKEGWTPAIEAVNEILNLDNNSLQELLGWKNPDEETLTKDEQITIVGKNLQIQNDIDTLKELGKTIKTDAQAKVFLRWFVAKNGRLMVDAEGGFNPQSNKLHRYATVSGDVEYRLAHDDEMGQVMFKLGFAQALGFKTDKRPVEESIAFADALLNTTALDGLHDNLNKGETKTEFTSKDDKTYTTAYVATADGEEEVKVPLVAKASEPMHTMTAIVEGRKYIKADGKDFNTIMTVEIDGLTNGFAHKMRQFLATSNNAPEINEKTVEWLNKTGFHFGTVDEVKSMVNSISDGDIVDAYWTLGKAMMPTGTTLDKVVGDNINKNLKQLNQASERLEIIEDNGIDSPEYANNPGKYHSDVKKLKIAITIASKKHDRYMELLQGNDVNSMTSNAKTMLDILPKLVDEDGDLLDTVRDLMKPAFMTFGYSAGFRSISRGISGMLIDDVMHTVMEAEHPSEVQGLLDIFGKDLDEFKRELKYNTYANIRAKDGRTVKDIFDGYVEVLYGDRVKEVVTKEFAGMMKINRAIVGASSLMSAIFITAYEDAVADKVGENGTLSKIEQQEVIDELMDLLPIVKAPDSKDRDDGIAIYDTKTVTSDNNKFGAMVVKRKVAGEGRSIKVKRRTFTSPGATLAVLLTHYSDASGASKTMLRHKVAQVFDAYVIGAGQSDIAKEANEDFNELSTSTNWSQTGAVLEALEYSLKAATNRFNEDNGDNVFWNNVQDRLATEMAEIIGITKEEYLDSKAYQSPAKTLEEFKEINKAVQVRRKAKAGFNGVEEQFAMDKYHAAVTKGKDAPSTFITGDTSQDTAKQSSDTTGLSSGGLYDIKISDKALSEITKFNNKYTKDSKVKIKESNRFWYNPETREVEVDKTATNEEKQVLLKHELLHHMTYEHIVKDLSKDVKTKLIKELENVNGLFDSLFREEDMMLVRQRFNYALSQSDIDKAVAEAVAIIGAEPQMREALNNVADMNILNKIIKKFIDMVKHYLGKEKDLSNSAKYVLDSVDTIIKDSSKDKPIKPQTPEEAINEYVDTKETTKVKADTILKSPDESISDEEFTKLVNRELQEQKKCKGN